MLCDARRKGQTMVALRKYVPIALLSLAVIVAGVVFMLRYGKEDSVIVNEKGNKEEDLSAREDPETSLEDRIEDRETVPSGTQDPSVCVHVCGSVREEGVYVLEAEARIADAIEAAGGFSEEAATSYLNLASKVTDGMKVYVPSVTEVEQGSIPAGDDRSTGVQTLTVSGSDNGRININTADRQTLMTLPGIGEARAGDIIAWREKHGGFKEITDIMKVSGIKEAMYERIKERICVR